MSNDPFWDIVKMHNFYGMTQKFHDMSPEELRAHLELRMTMQQEETTELQHAIEARDAEGVVDALIDGIVFALGTIHAFGIDFYEAWEAVLKANMSKQVGVKPERPNPLGLPDLIKPPGWTAPSHAGNHGMLGEMWTPCDV